MDKDMKDEAPKDKTVTRGVGLKISEWSVVDEIAEKLEVKPHAVVAYAMRHYLYRYKTGEVQIEVKTKNVLIDP